MPHFDHAAVELIQVLPDEEKQTPVFQQSPQLAAHRYTTGMSPETHGAPSNQFIYACCTCVNEIFCYRNALVRRIFFLATTRYRFEHSNPWRLRFKIKAVLSHATTRNHRGPTFPSQLLPLSTRGPVMLCCKCVKLTFPQDGSRLAPNVRQQH